MSYRPITDQWILARPKVKYYGAYPNGFLERARRFMPCTIHEPVLHACGGMVKAYPTWSRICPNDVTFDLDPNVQPDLVWDARRGMPGRVEFTQAAVRGRWGLANGGWDGILIDRPYTEGDADHYAPGREALPKANQLIRDAIEALNPGGRVGMLDYVFPQPPREGVRLVACIAVVAGYNNRIRCFSVFERM